MQFIFSQYPDVQHTHPDKSIYQLIVENCCLPRRTFHYCCWKFKRPYGEGRFKITGIRAAESHRRAKLPKLDISGNFRQLNLIHDWTTAEVWKYIRARNLPYCKLYDEGAKRLGCVFCLSLKRLKILLTPLNIPHSSNTLLLHLTALLKFALHKASGTNITPAQNNSKLLLTAAEVKLLKILVSLLISIL